MLPQTNFLRYGSATASRFHVTDNSWIILAFLPLLYLPIWATHRYHLCRKIFMNSIFVISLIILLALIGFGGLTSQLNELSHKRFPRPYPFDGAIGWLQQHAQENEVVLTLPKADGWNEDYITLYTNLKIYHNAFYAQDISVDSSAKRYRDVFCGALILGLLDKIPLGSLTTLGEKIRYLRLNYILVEIPVPNIDIIAAQLQKFSRPVYADRTCVLWKIPMRNR